MKIYENSLKIRHCSIHNIDQSVCGQNLSGPRQNASSVDCIRNFFLYKMSFIIINSKLRYSQRAFVTIRVMID